MTQIDSNRPTLFQVAINGSSFSGNTAPNDGFFDPTTIQRYMELAVMTGTTAPVVLNGDTIAINDISITFTTAGGLTGTGIVAAINALTDDHHVIASLSGGNLQLTNSATYENYGIQVTDNVNGAVLAEIGFTAPVTTYPYSAGVDTLAHSQAKSRGNSRWNTLMKLISFEATPTYVGGVLVTGGAPDTTPSAIQFTVAYQDFQNIYTYDETNNNALIRGIPALTRMVARAMVDNRIENQPVINPGTQSVPSGGSFVIGQQIEALVIDQIAGSLSTATATITVTPITTVR